MADEQTIFKGNPSPVAILGTLVLCAILFIGFSASLIIFSKKLPEGIGGRIIFWLPLIPLLVGMGKWIALSFLTYEITSERIKVIKGILGKRTDELELYRVKDTSLIEPFVYRMFGVGNISVITNDATTPALELRAIKNAKDVREKLRASIEECRARKRTGLVELE
jgi:uncharacterized membrane protein YdbT with pleckstrin-like domain